MERFLCRNVLSKFKNGYYVVAKMATTNLSYMFIVAKSKPVETYFLFFQWPKVNSILYIAIPI